MSAGLDGPASPGPGADEGPGVGQGPGAGPGLGGRDPRSLPVVRVLFRPFIWGAIAVLAVGVALAWTAFVWRPDLLDPTSASGDPWNYLAAVERLRDGGQLYAIGPGDRPVEGYPGTYPLPLLAPPTVAILVLPLALFPPAAAMTLWAVGGFVATISTVAWAIARGGIAVRALVIVLAYPIATTALSGNVNAYLMPVLVWTWLGMVPGRGAVGGLATGVAAAARIGPAFVGLLYVVRRRWTATAAAVITVGAIGLASVLVAGVEAWRVYVETTLRGTIEPTMLSVPGMLRSFGLGPQVTTLSAAALWVGVAVAIWLLRSRPRVAFAVAIVAAVYATPVVRMESWALFLAAASPWLIRDRGPQRPAAGVRAGDTRPQVGGAGRGVSASQSRAGASGPETPETPGTREVPVDGAIDAT